MCRQYAAPDELAAVETNEGWALVVLHSIAAPSIPDEIINRHGGAIALGHTISASGARLVSTLARLLAAHRSGSLGALGISGGGGQGSAIMFRAG